MGGPAGSGGSDKSDERKVDTYADQLKKEQARKSKYKIDKFGYKVKKNIGETLRDKHPIIRAVTNVSDQHNLHRRMKYANKLTEQGKDINIQGMSTEQILSKDFKAKLDSYGYSVEPGNVGHGVGDDSNQASTKSIEQPKVASQMDNTGVKSKLVVADKIAPTTVEMAQLSEEERLKKIKRKGKRSTVLTQDYEEKPTLSTKALLGK